MHDLVFHPSTKMQIDMFVSRPSHAVILAGPEGIGKFAASQLLASKLLLIDDTEMLDKYPYKSIIKPEGQSISIDKIRELIRFAKLKIPSANDGIKRLVIIDGAQLLTTEAQNSLLKLLEEPPADMCLILSASSDRSLLPTIRSRAQTIQIQTPLTQDLYDHFSKMNISEPKIKQALLMSGGLPGLMHAMLAENEEHPLAKAAVMARVVLKSDAFERQCMVDALSKQRTELVRVVFMIKQMAHAAIAQNASRNSDLAIGRWQKIQQVAYDAETALNANAQPKLTVTNLMLQI